MCKTFLAGKSRRLYKTSIYFVFLILPFDWLREGFVTCHGELVEPSDALYLDLFEQSEKCRF
jgi:hypothetical protein